MYAEDGLTSYHNHEFVDDPGFVAAYERGVFAAGRDYGWRWRVHIGLWAAATASRLPGDFVECGVNRGFMSSSILAALDWDRLGKTFYLLDTFAGVDERYMSPEEALDGGAAKNAAHLESGFYVCGSASVRANFSEWRRVEIIEGSIPDTLPRVGAREIAFLHLDLNSAQPEVAALEYFWSRMVPGAPVLLDDYAYHGFRHQKLAMDAVARSLGTSIASLPTGQGLIIKT
jgi:hypothetical protein